MEELELVYLKRLCLLFAPILAMTIESKSLLEGEDLVVQSFDLFSLYWFCPLFSYSLYMLMVIMVSLSLIDDAEVCLYGCGGVLVDEEVVR